MRKREKGKKFTLFAEKQRQKAAREPVQKSRPNKERTKKKKNARKGRRRKKLNSPVDEDRPCRSTAAEGRRISRIKGCRMCSTTTGCKE